jgi:hypothetical protein
MSADFLAEPFERARDYLVELANDIIESGDEKMQLPIHPGEYPLLFDAVGRILEAWEDGGSGDRQTDISVRMVIRHWNAAIGSQVRFDLKVSDLRNMAGFLNRYIRRKLQEAGAGPG